MHRGASQPSAEAINNAGTVVGSFVSSTGFQRLGFERDAIGNFSPIDLTGSLATIPAGIDNLGDVSGTFTDTNRVDHGFILVGGSKAADLIALDVPGSSSTVVNGITDINYEIQVVGRYLAPATGALRQAFIWDSDSGFTEFGVPEATETIAHGSSGAPEPSTLLLVITGLAGLTFRGLGRRRKTR